MANIVPELDYTKAYAYCPRCNQEGRKVELNRDGHRISCPYCFAPFEWTQLQKLGIPLEFKPLEIIEQPSPHAVKWPIFVAPGTKKLLEEKFHNRLWTTLGTVLDLLADDAVVFIGGEDAKELRGRGLKSGKDIVAFLKTADEREKEVGEISRQYRQLQALLSGAVGDLASKNLQGD